MTESKIRTLPESEAIDQIVETIQQADEGRAPFALVLGSGFSHGLVPTARELVSESLPLWMKSLKNNTPFETQKQLPAEERAAIAREFWPEFVKKNANRDLVLELEAETGLPRAYSDAYKAIFTSGYTGAVGEPAQARKFQRALMRLDKPRLNAAHFLLASLLGIQPGKSRKSDLFKARAAFSRLILTTNFDPFLQIALQSVNRLYFMSDTPEVGVSSEIFDDQTDAMHLVYLHGTIHRRLQAATEEDIQILKEKNARTLAPVLERHGVIVLGYSGWDDAIVEALAACNSFDHRLYWCGREADPLAKGAFGPRVAGILRKSSALYVQTTSAGHFMAKLSARLVKGLPRLLDNPIAQLREMLETIDLTELKNLANVPPATSKTARLIDIGSNTEAIVEAQALTLQRLLEAEHVFRGGVVAPTDGIPPQPPVRTPAERGRGAGPVVFPIDPKKQVQQLLSSARAAAALGNPAEALALCNQALLLAPIESGDQAALLTVQARAHFSLGQTDEAIRDWSRIIETADAPIEKVAVALYNRGVAWDKKGETQKELADYTRLIDELPDAPVPHVGTALFNRAVTWDSQGETEKALADYTRLAEQTPGAAIEDIASAVFNRGVLWAKKGETDKALADYTRLIEHLPGAPVGDIALALVNRSDIWSEKGETEKASADYNQVIEQLPNAPVEHVATALTNRGWLHYCKDSFSAFLADTEAAINKDPSSDVAAFNLGLALLAAGRDDEALQAYRSAAERFPQVIDDNGLADLNEAAQKWLTQARALPAIELLRSLKK
jgi:tetratricopeptide (TPR) repeat protein